MMLEGTEGDWHIVSSLSKACIVVHSICVICLHVMRVNVTV